MFRWTYITDSVPNEKWYGMSRLWDASNCCVPYQDCNFCQLRLALSGTTSETLGSDSIAQNRCTSICLSLQGSTCPSRTPVLVQIHNTCLFYVNYWTFSCARSTVHVLSSTWTIFHTVVSELSENCVQITSKLRSSYVQIRFNRVWITQKLCFWNIKAAIPVQFAHHLLPVSWTRIGVLWVSQRSGEEFRISTETGARKTLEISTVSLQLQKTYRT